MKKLNPIHPGKILLEEFLLPVEISQSKIAEDTGISLDEIEKIIEGKAPVTPNAALRLSLYFGLSEKFWLNFILCARLFWPFDIGCILAKRR